jgi:hypothetical protein
MALLLMGSLSARNAGASPEVQRETPPLETEAGRRRLSVAGRHRSAPLPDYRLLYFRGSRLERWESVEAPDHVAAIQEMSGRGSDRTVEIWSEDKKLAVVRPAKHSMRGRR